MPPKRRGGRKSTTVSVAQTARESDLENDSAPENRDDRGNGKASEYATQKGGKASITSGKSQVRQFPGSVSMDAYKILRSI